MKKENKVEIDFDEALDETSIEEPEQQEEQEEEVLDVEQLKKDNKEMKSLIKQMKEDKLKGKSTKIKVDFLPLEKPFNSSPPKSVQSRQTKPSDSKTFARSKSDRKFDEEGQTTEDYNSLREELKNMKEAMTELIEINKQKKERESEDLDSDEEELENDDEIDEENDYEEEVLDEKQEIDLDKYEKYKNQQEKKGFLRRIFSKKEKYPQLPELSAIPFKKEVKEYSNFEFSDMKRCPQCNKKIEKSKVYKYSDGLVQYIRCKDIKCDFYKKFEFGE